MSFADQPTLERARYLYQLRRYAAAIDATMAFLSKYPESAEAHCILALCYGKEKRRAESEEAGRAAVRYQPDWSHPYYVLALTAYWFDDYDFSLRALSEALRINPVDPDYHELLASIHYERGMYRTARGCAEIGLTYDPEHVGCLFQRGACLFDEKRLKEAEEVFRETLRLDPQHAGSQGLLGQIENSRGNFTIALPLLHSALRQEPRWKFVQDAWKEALRGSFPIYRFFARFRLSLDRFSSWPYYLLIYCIISAIICNSLIDSHPVIWNTIVTSLVLGFFVLVLLVVLLAGFLDASLQVLGLLMYFRSRELRNTMSFKRWLFQNWKMLVIVSVIVSIPFINWIVCSIFK